jgi:DNA helicase II / ATP-dependent DNA helicase PcrA
MPFLADLHVHSKYSRATSRDLNLEHLFFWAALKGIAVVGSGDGVHPGWLAEIKDKLAPDNGLFRLKPAIEAAVMQTLPPSCRAPVRFLLTTEISTIYKKSGKTRKVHHLLLLPNFAAADRLAVRLARIGNIASDGRPILGLDSRDLLEIALEAGAYLIPAHIWTPWFAALGSQSGFDSIAECYGDLAHHIFAVETGLSSDPAMNWRVSSLDGYRLVSNSDAHSPAKLGREATRFSCAPSYDAIRQALETGEGYDGTVEFFPEEGKYHLDGHRACEVRLDPKETLALAGLCPVCGKPVTVGVAHRVEMLADRAQAAPPPKAGNVTSLVPLPEILSELLGSGPASQSVLRSYDRVIAQLGPELSLLGELPLEEIARLDPRLSEAVQRLRAGAVIREAGYDGEYGVIRLFADSEREAFTKGGLLFEAPAKPKRQRLPKNKAPTTPIAQVPASAAPSGRSGILASLDSDQAAAAACIEGPLAVIAAPGSGKTRMLTHRLAHLIAECGVPPGSCLAVTFTRRATEEMKARLAVLLPNATPPVHSFHSLGLTILRQHGAALGLAPDFRIASEAERKAALAAALDISPSRANTLLKAVSVLKRTGAAGTVEEQQAAATLSRLSQEQNWLDFDDLVRNAVALLENNPAIAAQWQNRYILADEFQDIDEQQYRLLRLLAGAKANLCVIGDPEQAIYGFRGADASCFARFAADFPQSRTLHLARNYRSSGAVIAASAALMGRSPEGVVRPAGEAVELTLAADERDEAAFVADKIAELMGGHDMLAAKSGASLGFADFAVLYRTDAQSAALREAFDRAGIPFKKSTPALIASHPGVVALLEALTEQDGPDLTARLAVTYEAAPRQGTAAAQLSEAYGWLTTLAAGNDEARLREQAALASEADFHDRRADRVSLLTMHAAKGLEFSVVFVTGLEDGLTPLSFPGEKDDAEEERRLFYVAMTRAKDRLFLSRTRTRFWRGERQALPPSPFLDKLKLLTRSRSARPPQQYSLF